MLIPVELRVVVKKKKKVVKRMEIGSAVEIVEVEIETVEREVEVVVGYESEVCVVEKLGNEYENKIENEMKIEYVGMKMKVCLDEVVIEIEIEVVEIVKADG